MQSRVYGVLVTNSKSITKLRSRKPGPGILVSMQFLPPLHYGLVVFAHMRNAAYILDVGSVVTVKVRSH